MVTLTVSSFHDRPPDIFYSNAHRTFVSPLHQFQQACALSLVHPAKHEHTTCIAIFGLHGRESS